MLIGFFVIFMIVHARITSSEIITRSSLQSKIEIAVCGGQVCPSVSQY
jgi:hypothetical protein